MSRKKGKLPPLKTDALAMRTVSVQPATADSVKRSVKIVTATENPIDRWDERRGEVVAEVLEMDGMRMRPGATQIPIVDSHDTSTVRNVLGSLRNISVEGDEFGGIAYFASDDESQRAYSKLLDGHITDFSITAQPNEVLELRTGQKYTTSRGTEVVGPANVITNWTALDASLVATGADSRSTVRRSYTDLEQRKRTVDEALLGQLKEMGLPDGMEDPNQILAWVVGKLGKPAETVESMEEEAPAEEVVEQMDEEKPAEMVEQAYEDKPMEASARKAIEGEIKRAVADFEKADKKRRAEIQATCKLAKVERAFADELCDAGVSVEIAKQKVIERMATQPLGRSVDADVHVLDSSRDKQYEAMRDGLITRSLAYTTLRNRKLEKPADGHQDFVNLPIRRMAAIIFREELGLTFQHLERISELEIMRLAMLNPQALRRHRHMIRRDQAFNTTGGFANLLLDAMNKTLLASYEEAEYSYSIWARQGASTPDLKQIHRMRFSEFPNLEMIPENKEYPDKKMTDAKESYRPDKFGSMLTYSWEAFVNDDLDAFSKGPLMMGNAARRTLNQKCYEVLTANEPMGDGVALFGAHASGSNTSGAAAAPSITTLNAGFLSMRKQKGLNSDVAINVTPRFLIHGPAYEATVDELLVSTSYNAVNNNEGVKNLYGPDGPQKRRLIPVCDNALGDTTTDWFLAADQAQGVDTVEYTFLQGEESPVIDQEEDFDTDTYKFKIRQTFGVKAIDWRGLFRNSA
jgi:hypothetical protein